MGLGSVLQCITLNVILMQFNTFYQILALSVHKKHLCLCIIVVCGLRHTIFVAGELSYSVATFPVYL